MSTLHSNADSFVTDIEAALRQARTARRYLHGIIIPALPPVRRTVAEHSVRQIDRDAIFDEVLARDLEAFIGLIEREIVAGTHAGWEADEHHVRGGWEVMIRERAHRCPRAGRSRAETASIGDRAGNRRSQGSPTG